MFKRLICSVSIFVVLCLVSSSSADLVAHWKFDNDRSDSIGLLNWKLENGARYSTDSKEGSHSLSLDGTDDYAVQSAVGVLAEAFSTRAVTLWFKVDVDNVTQVLYDEGGADSGFSIRINKEQLQAAVRNAGIDIIATAALDSTGWTHAAVTFDNGSLSLYINGVERALATANFTTAASHKDAAGIGARNSQDAFGQRGTGDYFGGHIDDVRIYDNALSADEIEKLTVGRPAATVIVQPDREQPKTEPVETEPVEAEPVEAEPVETEPVEAEPEKPKPVEVSPVLDQLLRKSVFYIGPELYFFNYEEPGLMEETGMFYGVAFGAILREWVPDSPDQALADDKMMVRGEGRFAVGTVDYDGQYQDGRPLTMDGIDDYVFEGRLLLGPEWLSSNMLSTLYAGVGYRYLNDDSSFHPAGYERESNYYYIPIGGEISTSLQAGWSVVGRVEYDYFLWGLQKSHIGIIMENRQNSGHGYRASIKLQKKSKDVMFVIEPFFRYWDIDDSELEYLGGGYYGLEPANNTTEYGIQLSVLF